MIRKTSIVIIAVGVLFILICLSKGIGINSNEIDKAEVRIDRLEQRVGALYVIVYGKSTGLDKAMVRGKDEK